MEAVTLFVAAVAQSDQVLVCIAPRREFVAGALTPVILTVMDLKVFFCSAILAGASIPLYDGLALTAPLVALKEFIVGGL